MKAALFATALAVAGATAQSVPPFRYGTPSPNAPGVKGVNSNGPTNPKTPQLNTPINQKSESRLASLNSVDDWCTFGPRDPGTVIGDVEGETVAYCTKARNNARVIPDGTVTAAHFVKTPLYVQLMALGDFTKIGIVAGDEGGELDPHGATNMGNPVGGNVTSNVSGEDVFYEEWMNYVSYNQVCFRICIAGSDQAPTADVCEHELDVMGCNFVMPGNYADNVFETCDGDAAYPPGHYPQPDGSTSTFHQFFTGEYVVNGQTMQYTNGAADQVTPTAAYSTPSTSNCRTTDTIKNGIASLVPAVSSSSSSASSSAATSTGASSSGMASSRAGSSTSGGSRAPAATGSNSASGASSSSGNASGALSLQASGILASLAAVVAGAYLL
ncbi:uncharacterized protein PFL1_06776 [Pseudozyma flocculosa PF-1]|uniref:88 kDa immunoreactive mannoprotein MP88 n=2 Tax=Pseudozyma flocculosa TaxID=84751 RepID=A0A5C3FEC0_9BASI|nr:uncharacterized protein PFL1_06776 [Pseudozyma flocculosa PF-1]EPQ25639.1 hypothetical protein PFL1_06776 [Pseudozyma flocculosa PF-1]SPO42045.1 uncharacterized protein PSFLO_07528 [Pseudozyma flocculosa]